jgi:energy-coupling factor transporter ATP-binding protein EcfA2
MTTDENNSVFQLATNFVNQTSEHIFLTGKAGTGKTTFLKHIRVATHKNTIVAAPTGVAAVNAEGVTLHSLFQLPFEPHIPGTPIAKEHFFRFSKPKLELLKQLELLIIDEVSMLRADTLDAIDATLRTIRKNTKPFGGVQMLYIGDLFQLPPVAKDDEWNNLLKNYYSSTFFFSAHSIQQTHPVYLELKKVYRQGDPVFVDLLNRVRNNIVTEQDIQTLNGLHRPNFEPKEEENYIILTTHNYKADRINNDKLAALPGQVRSFAGEISGEFPENSLPTDLNLRLKIGAQVMFLKNDVEKHRYFNGKIGVISDIVADQIHVYLSDQNETVIVKKEIWENKKYELNKSTGEIVEEYLGDFKQYPLRLAWAITIHKSQGLTFEKAIIDIGASFAAGQAYVALSRCTSLDGIVLYSKIASNCIMTNPLAVDFSKSEQAEGDLQQLFSRGKQRFWAERLLLYFDWRDMYLILRDMEKLLSKKESTEYYPAKALLKTYMQKVRELEDVSLKFQNELRNKIASTPEDQLMDTLKDRCQKAVTYYRDQVIAHLITPLQQFIRTLPNIKKNKTAIKNMTGIVNDMQLFLEKMKKVRFNDEALI